MMWWLQCHHVVHWHSAAVICEPERSGEETG